MKMQSWMFALGVVLLAAIPLWLRDRFRDFRHVPQAARKLSENKAGELFRVLLSFLSSLLALYGLQLAQNFGTRALYAGCAIFYFCYSVEHLRRYLALRRTHSTSGM